MCWWLAHNLVQELIEGSLYGYDGDENTLFIELDCGHVLEKDFVDQWMATQVAQNTEGEPGDQMIALKACPVCKSTIRKCNRYNKNIKVLFYQLSNFTTAVIPD